MQDCGDDHEQRGDDETSSIQDDASTRDLSSRSNHRSTQNILNSHDKMVPPYPREGGDQSYNASSAPSVAESVVSDDTVTTRQNGDRTGYNAWGPEGQIQHRAASVTTGTASQTVSVATTTTANTPVATNRNGWAKINGRKMGVEMPDRLAKGKIDDDAETKRYAYDSSGSEDEC